MNCEDYKSAVFDPNRALFICNKWDQIHEDEEEVFLTVQTTLDQVWPSFKPEQLFVLSARDVNII